MDQQGAGKSTECCHMAPVANPAPREPLVLPGMHTGLSLRAFHLWCTRSQLVASGYVTNETVMTNESINERDNRESGQLW